MFSFLGKGIFENCVKTTSLKNLDFLVFTSLVDHTVHIRTEACMKIAFKQRFHPPPPHLKKNAFLDISSPNYAKAS